jgi:hypothetical protein
LLVQSFTRSLRSARKGREKKGKEGKRREKKGKREGEFPLNPSGEGEISTGNEGVYIR